MNTSSSPSGFASKLTMNSRDLFLVLSIFLLPFSAMPASGQEYKVAKLDSPALTGAVAPEISSLLESTGFKVSKGSSALCEVWLAKEWPIAADAKTGGE